MPSIHGTSSDVTASAQVTAGVSVSFQIRPIACLSIDFFVIEQTALSAHNLGVSTLVSAPEIADLALVSVPVAGVNLDRHILNNHLTTASIRLPMTTS